MYIYIYNTYTGCFLVPGVFLWGVEIWSTLIIDLQSCFKCKTNANSNWLEAVTDGWGDGYRSIAGGFNAFSFTSRIGDEVNLVDFCIFFQMVHIFQIGCFTPGLKINSFDGVKSSSCPI